MPKHLLESSATTSTTASSTFVNPLALTISILMITIIICMVFDYVDGSSGISKIVKCAPIVIYFISSIILLIMGRFNTTIFTCAWCILLLTVIIAIVVSVILYRNKSATVPPYLNYIIKTYILISCGIFAVTLVA